MATAEESYQELNAEELDEKLAQCVMTQDVKGRKYSISSDATTQTDGAVANGKQTDGKPFKVFIAVDSSPWSAFAIDWYLKNANRPNHDILFYHTMDRPAVHGDEYCVSVEADQAVMKGCESNAQDLHNDCVRKLEEYKVTGRVLVQFSVIGYGEAIVDAALKEKAEMIVVGTRGKGAVRRTLTGSVADYVLHHAHCPVIVCCRDRPRRRSSRLSSSNSISEDIIT